MTMESANKAISILLREQGDVIKSASIEKHLDTNELYILAIINKPVDFFPDLISGIPVVQWIKDD